MKRNMLFIWLGISILCISGCQNGKNNVSPSPYLEWEIPSVIAMYPNLINEAQKWDDDALLETLIIDVHPPNSPTQTRTLSAFFHTVNKDTEYFYIEYYLDGTLSSEVGNYRFPRKDFLNLELTDFLDSHLAWEAFLSNPNVASYSKDDFKCSELILVPNYLEGKFIWRLAVGGCGDNPQKLFEFDATSIGTPN